jgi:hypothetical protein
MNLLALKSGSFLFLFCGISCFYSVAQTSVPQLSQDPKIERLLAEKRKINSAITVTDKYKIQLFSGESDLAKKTLIDFRKECKTLDAMIVFNTPSYKVWVGNFKSRIEVERALIEIKKKYPAAFVVKPTK